MINQFSSNDPHLVISLDAIRANFSLLREKARSLRYITKTSYPPITPVVKSNAYGHGLIEVSLALAQDGAESFAVGTVEEGGILRHALNNIFHRKNKARFYSEQILSLLGAETQREVLDAMDHSITLCLHRKGQLKLYAEAAQKHLTDAAHRGATAFAQPLKVALKVDTGMHRLGFSVDEAIRLVSAAEMYPQLEIELIFTHLACADMPEEKDFSLEQARLFFEGAAKIQAINPELCYSFRNSAGLLAAAKLLPDMPQQFPLTTRPGIALYGSNPLEGTAAEAYGAGLTPAMEMFAPVLEVKDIAKGASVSYGRTYKAEQDSRIAIIRTGYSDGYHRGLSSVAPALLAGQRTHVLGRVCMQLLAIEVPRVGDGFADVAPGDLACLLGGRTFKADGSVQKVAPKDAIKAEELAALAGTIPYEVYCSLGINKKIYQSGNSEYGLE